METGSQSAGLCAAGVRCCSLSQDIVVEKGLLRCGLNRVFMAWAAWLTFHPGGSGSMWMSGLHCPCTLVNFAGAFHQRGLCKSTFYKEPWLQQRKSDIVTHSELQYRFIVFNTWWYVKVRLRLWSYDNGLRSSAGWHPQHSYYAIVKGMLH